MKTGEIVLTIFGSIMASTGFWALIQKLMERKGTNRQILVALAHDRLMFLCQKYIDKGYVTPNQLEDLMYIYGPYKRGGGNGAVEALMEDVKRLPKREKEDES